MAMIKGQTVRLHEKTVVGRDPFGAALYSEQVVDVDNVLLEPASNDAVISELQLTGKHIAYILHIPKGDAHEWKDTVVEFYGDKWKTYGDCLIYDEAMTPLDWNKKVKVERYE